MNIILVLALCVCFCFCVFALIMWRKARIDHDHLSAFLSNHMEYFPVELIKTVHADQYFFKTFHKGLLDEIGSEEQSDVLIETGSDSFTSVSQKYFYMASETNYREVPHDIFYNSSDKTGKRIKMETGKSIREAIRRFPEEVDWVVAVEYKKRFFGKISSCTIYKVFDVLG